MGASKSLFKILQHLITVGCSHYCLLRVRDVVKYSSPLLRSMRLSPNSLNLAVWWDYTSVQICQYTRDTWWQSYILVELCVHNCSLILRQEGFSRGPMVRGLDLGLHVIWQVACFSSNSTLRSEKQIVSFFSFKAFLAKKKNIWFGLLFFIFIH